MNTYDPMNMNNYAPAQNNSNNNWNMPRTYNTYTSPQPRLSTNAIFVTSLEEALIKTVDRPSDIIYFHQDKPEFYRVKVDVEGRKTWAAFNYSSPSQEENIPATKADIQELIARIEALEETRGVKTQSKKKKEVNENAESNGQNTVFTFDNN